MQGINHDHAWPVLEHPDLFNHLEVADGGVEVAAVLGEPHIELSSLVVVFPRCYPASQAVVAFSGQIDHIALAYLVACPAFYAACHA